MLYLINLVLGYVEIQVTGPYIERFLNLLSAKGFVFWDLVYTKPYEITLKLRARQFKKLPLPARRTTSKIKLIKKRGLPFFTHRFKKRPALVVGVLFFCAIVWAFTCFIWVIDISGGDSSLHGEILKRLEYNGVKFGAYSQGINYDEMKNDVLLAFPQLANITVNINGCFADVKIYPKTPIPKIIDYSQPSNLISDYDGIITSITITSGNPEVKPGDTVIKGQLLASSYITGRTGVDVQYRAIGNIRAKTWEQIKLVFPEKTLKKTYSGRVKSKHTLLFGKKRINLYFGTSNCYDSCDKIVKKVYITLPFDLKIPIGLETCMQKEYFCEEYFPSDEEFKVYLSKCADKYVFLKENDRIIHKQYAFSRENGMAILNYTAECDRNIGVEQMIPKGE